MRKRKLSAAELVAARFGGQRVVGRLLGRDETICAMWIARGGHIPQRYGQYRHTHQQLLALARRQHIALTQQELLEGGIP